MNLEERDYPIEWECDRCGSVVTIRSSAEYGEAGSPSDGLWPMGMFCREPLCQRHPKWCSEDSIDD